MSRLLYLVHRLPYPPNKGDKVRSYHLLKHLARHHEVFLGTFVDDPDDWAYRQEVDRFCAGSCIQDLNPRLAKLKSLTGLISGEALTIPYYRNAALKAWVDRTIRERDIDAVVVFSSAMAQYVPASFDRPCLIDFVDVDSAKWSEYASRHRWPMSWIYKREGERLLAFERTMAKRAGRSFFVTENEVALFVSLAPECRDRLESVPNGVDSDFFQPSATYASPYPVGSRNIVFTGAMDYWPNIDAVTWFASEILPMVRKNWPGITFYIVGRSPTPAVAKLAGDGVVVTGTVDDVRPYIEFADVVVAPLRVARGVQNKILEAMAMSRPVVAALPCVEAIGAEIGRDVVAAETADEYGQGIHVLLEDVERGNAIGKAARDFVVGRYSWEAHLSKIDHYLVNGENAQ